MKIYKKNWKPNKQISLDLDNIQFSLEEVLFILEAFSDRAYLEGNGDGSVRVVVDDC